MANIIKVRKFTAHGMRFVEEVIKNKDFFDPKDLNNPDYTEYCLSEEIDLDVVFSNKFELTKYLYNELNGSIAIDNEDAGMWTWLFFAFFDELMRFDKQGTPNPLANKEHYIFKLKGNHFDGTYRHFIYTRFMAYLRWKDRAIIFEGTTTRPAQWGDYEEQFLSRRILYQYFDIFYDLFWDSSADIPIKDANLYMNSAEALLISPPLHSDGIHYKGYGGLRRWIKKIEQKARIHRLHGLTQSNFLKIFKPEF